MEQDEKERTKSGRLNFKIGDISWTSSRFSHREQERLGASPGLKKDKSEDNYEMEMNKL